MTGRLQKLDARFAFSIDWRVEFIVVEGVRCAGGRLSAAGIAGREHVMRTAYRWFGVALVAVATLGLAHPSFGKGPGGGGGGQWVVVAAEATWAVASAADIVSAAEAVVGACTPSAAEWAAEAACAPSAAAAGPACGRSAEVAEAPCGRSAVATPVRVFARSAAAARRLAAYPAERAAFRRVPSAEAMGRAARPASPRHAFSNPSSQALTGGANSAQRPKQFFADSGQPVVRPNGLQPAAAGSRGIQLAQPKQRQFRPRGVHARRRAGQ